MKGHIRRRGKGSWALVLDVGRDAAGKRQQKWITVRGTKREAEATLAALVDSVNRGTFVHPTKVTVGQWLDEWLERTIKPTRALRTYETYLSVITVHLKPQLGGLRLQDLRALDLERYYAGRNLAGATLQKHQAVMHSALEAATRSGLVPRNVAKLVNGKPRASAGHEDVLAHVWEAHEARQFLVAAKAAGPQQAAFYSVALETGMRKAELGGLKWTDLDAGGSLTVQRQLVKPGPEPTYGPVKNKAPRVLALAPDTLALLKAHRAHQAELKMRHRQYYRDHGLMFAKEWPDMRRSRERLGDPLQINNIGQREFAKLIQAAGVRRIKFHGMRHTCATLLLQAGVPANVVQRRLGHKRIEMTLGIYGHALPSMQQDAAARLGALLHR